MEEDLKNLQEIINLSKEEIKSNNENITAILDLEDLKSLENLLTRYKQLEEENNNMLEKYLVNNPGMAKYLNDNYIFKSKVKEKFQNKRNEIFSCTYVDDEQWKPFDKALDIINDLEQDLLREE